jgi:hypothetical protein
MIREFVIRWNTVVINRFLVLLAASLFVAIAPSRAVAHDLHAKVKLPGDAVVVEAGFDDDTPAEGARVVITGSNGAEVVSGKTDETGVCRLPKLAPGKYTATVESLGHRDVVEFEVAESGGFFEFSNWRLDKRLGLAIGVSGLLLISFLYWLIRRPAAP